MEKSYKDKLVKELLEAIKYNMETKTDKHGNRILWINYQYINEEVNRLRKIVGK